MSDLPSAPRSVIPSEASPGRSRRGMSAMLVLVLISVTLAVSYAVLRTQGTTQQIRQNADLQAAARQAALAGLSVALQKMHGDPNDWVGADASFSQSLGSEQGFTVEYATGDPLLSQTAPEYPYRVTVTSTGYAQDPSDAARVVYHAARAVVQLIPREVIRWSGWRDPIEVTTYRLYPRGAVYYIETPSCTTLTGALQPNLATNPLGLFRSTSTMRLAGGAAVRGTLVVDCSSADIEVSGTGNTVAPAGLTPDGLPAGVPSYAQPPYATAPASGEIRVRLPSLVSGRHFVMGGSSRLAVVGTILAEDFFCIHQNNAKLTVTGNPANRDVTLYKILDVYLSNDTWTNDYNESAAGAGVTLWPNWLSDGSFTLSNVVTVQSEATAARFHRYVVRDDDGDGVGDPLFVPHADDVLPCPNDGEPPGLRWDLIRWEDGV
ncbi:MAG: hypothetical protein JW809_14215 [Pirellulales bacterium]|nr:hypothetical protein [Pirellulales bacterium]